MTMFPHLHKHQTRYMVFVIVGVLALLVSYTLIKTRAAGVPVFVRSIIYPLDAGDHYIPVPRPAGFAFNSSGNLYVSDQESSSVLVFDPSGNFVMRFGEPGMGNGQFINPGAISFDQAGNIYVADMNNGRIEKFDQSGSYLSQITFSESGNEIQNPQQVVLDSSGNEYVLTSSLVAKLNSNGDFVSSFNNPAGSAASLTIDAAGTTLYRLSSGFFLFGVLPSLEKLDTDGNLLATFTFPIGSGNGELANPSDLAVDSSGNIYVVDNGNQRVQKFDSNGTYVSQFGTSGSGNGQFFNPQSVSLDSSGNIYVTDPGNNRVQKFNSSGVYQSQFGTSGSGNGQFSGPRDIFIDQTGSIYVTDIGNSRIQKFNSSGVYQSQFGTPGSADGEFSFAQGLFVDASGNIHVADTNNNRIQKFSSAHAFLSKISYIPPVGFEPKAIIFESNGNILVANSFYHTILRFDSTGTYLSRFGDLGSGNGQFSSPQGLALDASGNIYVADAGNNRVQKFNSSGVYQSQFGTLGSGDGELSNPSGILVDSSGAIYVSDTNNSRVQKFDSTGTYVSQFGTSGSGNGQFSSPQDLFIDASGDMYVLDTSKERIQKFASSTYAFLSKWARGNIIDPDTSWDYIAPVKLAIGSSTSDLLYTVDDDSSSIFVFTKSGTLVSRFGDSAGEGQLSSPRNVALDSHGNVYVADSSLGIVKYAANGTFSTSTFFSMDDGVTPYAFNGPLAITFDSADNVYVADGFGSSGFIEKFDASGVHQGQIGNGQGSAQGQLDGAKDLFVDAGGNLYVADSFNCRVQKFDSAGAFVMSFGTCGSSNGQFSSLSSVAVDSLGKIYTTDSFNGYQKFDSDGSFLLKFTGTSEVILDYAQDIALDSDENIYIADEDSSRITVWSAGASPSPLVISNTAAQATDSGATITWTTDAPGNSQVEYGLNESYGSMTSLADISPMVTSHAVTLSSLTSCSAYQYRVLSSNGTATTTSSNRSFTTTGCAPASISSGGGYFVYDPYYQPTANATSTLPGNSATSSASSSPVLATTTKPVTVSTTTVPSKPVLPPVKIREPEVVIQEQNNVSSSGIPQSVPPSASSPVPPPSEVQEIIPVKESAASSSSPEAVPAPVQKNSFISQVASYISFDSAFFETFTKKVKHFFFLLFK